MLLMELLIKPKKEKPKKKKVLKESAEESSIQEMILTQLEMGQLTPSEAWARIKKVTPTDELFFWEMEFHSCCAMLDDESAVPTPDKSFRMPGLPSGTKH